MRSPIYYYGGKGIFVRKLLELIPRHSIYVEVFGGGASLLFAKPPSSLEVYNDINSNLVNLFRVLRDPEKFEKFYKLICFTPWSREEYRYCVKTFDKVKDEVERAYRFFVAVRQSFSGTIRRGWSFSLTSSHRNMAAVCSRWLSTIEMLPQVHERIMRVQIENGDFREIIRKYDTEDTFFYCDPPYIHETRKKVRYDYEMSDQDHMDLVELLLEIKGKVILSGYRHPIYELLEKKGFMRKDYETACYAVGRTRQTGILGDGSALKKIPRVESLWISPNAIPEEERGFQYELNLKSK